MIWFCEVNLIYGQYGVSHWTLIPFKRLAFLNMDAVMTLLYHRSLYHSQENWKEHGFQMYGHLLQPLHLGLRKSQHGSIR